VPSPPAVSADRGRLFVALELDDTARSALVAWRAEVLADHPAVRPVAEDALHVTLCFLGSCALEEVDAIAAACAIGSAAPLAGLRLGAVMWLPPRRPRVLAVAIEDDTGALARVQSALARALQAGGWYRRGARPFLAHVTVARVAKDGYLRPPALPPPPALSLAETRTVTLYRSHLSSRGSRYEPVRVIAVDGSLPPAPGGDPEAVVRHFHAEQAHAYAGGDLGRLRPLLAPDVVWHVPGRSRIAGEHQGLDAVLAYFDTRRRLTDTTFRVIVHDVLAAGERVIQLAGGRAVRDGAEVRWETVGIFRVADGRIAECWLIPFDLYAFDEVWS
jgi:2'-5' RNA ligase